MVSGIKGTGPTVPPGEEFSARANEHLVQPASETQEASHDTGHGAQDDERSRNRQSILEAQAVTAEGKTRVPKNVYDALSRQPGFDPGRYEIDFS